jgi:hypothetical protein
MITDLDATTRVFSPDNIIGDGSFGLVYCVVLPDGGAVAVKRLLTDDAVSNCKFPARAEFGHGRRRGNLVYK